MSADAQSEIQDGEVAVKIENETEEAPKNGDAEDGNATGADDTLNATLDSELGKLKKVHPGGKTMIVKNLPASMLFTYEEELRNLFSKYGQIKYIKYISVDLEYRCLFTYSQVWHLKTAIEPTKPDIVPTITSLK